MEEKNSIVEIDSDTENTLYDNKEVVLDNVDTQEEIIAKPIKPRKKLSKKGIIIIVISTVLLLAIIGVVIYFVCFRNKNNNNNTSDIEKVVVQKDNYVYEDGILKIKNANNEEIGKYTCVDTDIEKCYVAYLTIEDDNDLPKYYDEDNNLLKLRSSVYYNRFVFIYDEGVIRLYDLNNNETVETYDAIKTPDINSTLVVVKSNNKYGLIEVTMNKIDVLLDTKYEHLSLQDYEDKIVYSDGKNSYLIDTKGEKVTNPLRGTIKSFNPLYIALYNKGYSLYDYKGTKLLSDLDFITFYQGYVITVNNDEIYIYDQDLSKVNEEGIAIDVKDYSTSFIFDKNNNFKESIKPFTISAGDGFITISLNNGLYEKTYNTFDAIINQRYDYVNYLDGKIYIYDNKEKTEILGIYKCNNVNKTTSADDNFENCFIAFNSNDTYDTGENYLAPIIANKYIVINDTKDASTPKINIYDIIEKKYATNSATNYKSVDFKVADANIISIETLNNIFVAQNSSGNYGLLSIDKDGLKSIIKFTDNNNGGATKKISIFKDIYYVVERDKNYLYSGTGELISSSNYDIVDYKYNKLVVKNNNYYMIYSGGTILSNDYLYVDLNDNYYVGINKNNKLNIYNYSSNNGLLENSLTVNKIDDYENSYKIVPKYNDYNALVGYSIKIVNNDNTETEYKYNADWSVSE